MARAAHAPGPDWSRLRALRRLFVWQSERARLAPTNLGAKATSNSATGLFIVSASQAAHRDHDDPGTWATIDTVNLERFWLEARGELPPLSLIHI